MGYNEAYLNLMSQQAARRAQNLRDVANIGAQAQMASAGAWGRVPGTLAAIGQRFAGDVMDYKAKQDQNRVQQAKNEAAAEEAKTRTALELWKIGAPYVGRVLETVTPENWSQSRAMAKDFAASVGKEALVDKYWPEQYSPQAEQGIKAFASVIGEKGKEAAGLTEALDIKARGLGTTRDKLPYDVWMGVAREFEATKREQKGPLVTRPGDVLRDPNDPSKTIATNPAAPTPPASPIRLPNTKDPKSGKFGTLLVDPNTRLPVGFFEERPPAATAQAAMGGQVPNGVVGEDALAGVPAGMAQVVRQVANYSIPLPSGFALRSPYWQKVLELASAYKPTFDAKEYPTRLSLIRDFKSGKAATNIRSLNTAIGHLETLQDAGKGLNNRANTFWNTAANFGLSTMLGDPGVVKFNTAATAVENELASLFKGTGATDQEIKAWRQSINSSASPAQIQAVISQAVELLGSRLGALRSQYEVGLKEPAEFGLLNDTSRRILGKFGVDVDTVDPKRAPAPWESPKPNAPSQPAPQAKPAAGAQPYTVVSDTEISIAGVPRVFKSKADRDAYVALAKKNGLLR
jgi:hypothetical protein